MGANGQAPLKSNIQFKFFNQMEVQQIPIWLIRPSALNPRKTIDEGAVTELSESILAQGLLQPITVRPSEYYDEVIDGNVASTPVRYEIVCGERRYRAMCKIAGAESETYKVPCIVREMSDEEALDAMITENLQRNDVDPIEEAYAFGQMARMGKTVEELSLRFCKSRRFITERIKLDALLPEFKKRVREGTMTIGAAMHLCKLSDEEQKQALERFSRNEMITLSAAKSFTQNLFMHIEGADWNGAFKGSCGTTCKQCPMNSANAGCLFYEMKDKTQLCTDRKKFDRKRRDWILHTVEGNAGVLVEEGADLEAGMSVIAASHSPYNKASNEMLDELVLELRKKNYRVVEVNDIFRGYSSYDPGDPRLQDKLAANEVYRCVCITADWRGVSASVKFLEFKKEAGNETSNAEVEAMNLVKEYKGNIERKDANEAKKLKELLDGISGDDLSADPLDDDERMALLIILLMKTSYLFRMSRGLQYGGERLAKYALEHTDEANRIVRDFIRSELSQGVEYKADLRKAQSLIATDWLGEESAEAVKAIRDRFDKKQSKIEKRLRELGYDTEGKKIDDKSGGDE